MSQTVAPAPYANLTSSQAIRLAPAMTALQQLRLPAPYNYYAATLLVEVVQAGSDYLLGHMEGQGLGFARGLHVAGVIDEYECADLRQVFKEAADALRHHG
jgi:hypothetical protein